MGIETDRLYDLIETRTGIARTVDWRLEEIARDRALEARYQVGLDCVEPCEITHPVNQLKARAFPLQGVFKGVWENAFWTYKAADQADPYTAALEAWWASPVHRANLLRAEATHQGLGVHSEVKPGSPHIRYYFVHVFTKELLPSFTGKAVLRKGSHTGREYHDDGNVATTATATWDRDKAFPVLRRAVINGEPMLQLAGGSLAGYWVHEGRFIVFKDA